MSSRAHDLSGWPGPRSASAGVRNRAGSARHGRHRRGLAGILAAGAVCLVAAGVSAMAPVARRGADGAGERVRHDGDMVVRVTIRTLRDLLTMEAVSEDCWSERTGVGATADYRVSPDGLAAIRRAGMTHEILIPDLQALLDAEAVRLAEARDAAPAAAGDDPSRWYLEYRDTDEVVARLFELAVLRPDLVTPFTVGPSLLGEPVYGIRISTVPADVSTLPGVFIHGCQHAREWISVMVTMYLADALVRRAGSDPEIDEALSAVEFFLVPIVNPDGYRHSWGPDRLWRKNRRDNGGGSFGVDTNRNWGYQWGGEGSSGNPASLTYRGTAPFSEPETANLRDFVLANPRIVSHIDVHSYGQFVLQPWGWTTDLPSDHLVYDVLGQAIVDAIGDAGGAPFTHGPTASTLYVASGGAADWTVGDRDIAGLTIELRDTGTFGFILPPDRIIPSGEEMLPAFLDLARWSARPAAIAWVDGPPATVLADAETPIAVVVRAVASPVERTSVRLRVRTGGSGPFTMIAMQESAPRVFESHLPAVACGEVIAYFLEFDTGTGETVTDPAEAPATVHAAEARRREIIVQDDFSRDSGWTVGAVDDDATGGIWVRVAPVGTQSNGVQVQPGAAYSGQFCWVTGQHPGGGAGANDVDNGKTTLFSPWIDLGAVARDDLLEVSYRRWYSNGAGAGPNTDVFIVDLTADGATWINVETIGPAGAGTGGGWIRHAFDPRDLALIEGPVQVRFVASDEDPQSLVEAAIDQFEVIIDRTCLRPGVPGDLTGDGTVDFADVLALLAAWGPCPERVACPADLDGDGGVGLGDLLQVLANWS